ncbi:MAG TPA: DUF4326 domain-containing protein [Gaiellales bacterium]|jgi:hypothetical protein|nr:DUF4326 domain-containing protein [Gaiellales bacterium]
MPRRLKRGGRYTPIQQGSKLVTRSTRWGNPHRIREHGGEHSRRQAAERYAADLAAGRLRVSVEDVRRELAGFDLVCECEPEDICHADHLLRVANSPPGATVPAWSAT